MRLIECLNLLQDNSKVFDYLSGEFTTVEEIKAYWANHSGDFALALNDNKKVIYRTEDNRVYFTEV